VALLGLAPVLFAAPSADAGPGAAASHGKAGRTARHPLRGRRVPPRKAGAASGFTVLHAVPSGASFRVTEPPVGLSIEYPTMAADLGSGPCPPPSLVSALRQLGSPPLSLGGDSQDLTIPSGARPTGPPSWQSETLYTLPSAFWSQLHCLLAATSEPLDAGLNAKLGNLAWTEQMAAGAASAATNGLELSLGNEPDLYYLPNYVSLAAPQINDEAQAATLYLHVAQYLEQGVTGQSLIGPELASAQDWRRQLPRIVGGLHLQSLGVHLYPTTACGGKLTTEELLSPTVGAAPSALSWVVTDANGQHIPAIISEANSASCGGEPGVSDSPAAAVWAVRFVLSALKTGFREVRFHFSNGAYDPFVMEGSTLVTRPLESALASLNHWLPAGTSVRALTGLSGVLATAVSGSPAGVQLILDNEQPWACIVSMGGALSAHVEEFTATHSGPQGVSLRTEAGVMKLVIPGNTVAAVAPSTAPAQAAGSGRR